MQNKETKEKEWYVITLFGKYKTILTDRNKWEELGYTYHETDDEIILKKN
jgi:hypothetical protein